MTINQIVETLIKTKPMKQIITMLVVILLLSSCNKEESTPNDLIVGEWKQVATYYFDSSANKTTSSVTTREEYYRFSTDGSVYRATASTASGISWFFMSSGYFIRPTSTSSYLSKYNGNSLFWGSASTVEYKIEIDKNTLILTRITSSQGSSNAPYCYIDKQTYNRL